MPLDGSPLAEEALPVARELAASLHSPLLLVRAGLRSIAFAPVSAVGALLTPDLEEETRLAGEYLAALATRAGIAGSGARTLVGSGPPAEVVAAVADERGAALTVLATHGRTGLERLLLGSVAEAVCGEARPRCCSSRRHRPGVGAAGRDPAAVAARGGARRHTRPRRRSSWRATV